MSGNSQPNHGLPSGSPPVRPSLFPISNSSNDHSDGLQNGAGQGGVAANGADGADATEGEDADGQEEFSRTVRPGPPVASPAERDNHEAGGHSTFRSWCPDCVAGRGRARPHLSKDHSADQIPLLSWNYGFLSTK